MPRWKKAIIWFVCIVCYSFIQALCKENGIVLGAIPTFILVGVFLSLAQFLCSYGERRAENDKSPRELPHYIIRNCETLQNDAKQLKRYLKSQVHYRVITKGMADDLIQKYGSNM